MNPKLAKLIVKTAVGAIFTFVLGKTYILGQMVDERIDNYYAEPEPEQND